MVECARYITLGSRIGVERILRVSDMMETLRRCGRTRTP